MNDIEPKYTLRTEEYPNRVDMGFSQAALDWCLSEVGVGNFFLYEIGRGSVWLFKETDKALMFKLRWSA